MTNKLKVLKKIATILNDNKVTWAVSASVLLYFYGIVDEFHDIDIMIDDEDSELVIKLMNQIGELQYSPYNSNFKTKHFLEYIIDDVDIDIMGGFIVVKDNIDYDCSLDINYIDSHIKLDGIDIPLYSLKKWREFYFLINRENKVKLIDDYFIKDNLR